MRTDSETHKQHATRPLRIAWLGPAPNEEGGVRGVSADLLEGLARCGHRLDCFFPSAGEPVPERFQALENVTFIWGTMRFEWGRWYSGSRVTASLSGLLMRAIASLRLRREILRRHRSHPYDLVYQFSTIESPGAPTRLLRSIPLVLHPETHAAGELRALLAERRLALRSQSAAHYAAALAVMAVRSAVQRATIHRARLLVCISAVFRDHMVRDYRFPAARTVVAPNPIRIGRFATSERRTGTPANVLVLGRIAARKGIQDVVGVARGLLDAGVSARIRIVGGPSLLSDYTPLLEDLPPQTSEYVGSVPAEQVPDELAGADVLLQASRYEPFALTVAEALAAGVPVVATTEVGAVERVDPAVAARVAPGDVAALTAALVEMLESLRRDSPAIHRRAREEAVRLFATDVVAGEISSALGRLVDAPAPR